MRIGIDARSILNPEKNPAIGVGHYTYQLIRHLLKIDKENEYVLFFDYRVREKDVKKFSQENVEIKYFPWSDYKKYLPGAYSEILGLATVSRNKLDLLHITSPDARVPVGHRGKVICTFQDLAVYKQPDLFPTTYKVKARYNRQAMAKRADQIVAVSENTKRDLTEIFKISAEKVNVIQNGVDERFFDERINEEGNKKVLREKFEITGKYILFIGTIEPIKNITRLLRAFAVFKENLEKKGSHEKYQLILGGKKGWLSGFYHQMTKDLGIEKYVKFLGYIEGDDLKKLFQGSEIFVMPSLYEGFGVTVLEAMASKAPCLVSDLKTLRETSSQAAEFFNPFDVEELANKMELLVSDDKKRERMINEGFVQSRKFSWDKCARETLDVYKKVLNKK
ncbi:MAG: glycosyltransferase family 1 protein [Patescibacteria group bacterium]|jgi:glycosyltransferase involved in cell wall biosynthesis|nr:glycosyltransferase family 1 protein [Patescibacteria group bacterium]